VHRLHHRLPRRDRPQQRHDQRPHLEAARINAAKRFLFSSSSACIYPMYLQKSPDVTNLKEEDAKLRDEMESACRYLDSEGSDG
jgi:hypothetical protein